MVKIINVFLCAFGVLRGKMLLKFLTSALNIQHNVKLKIKVIPSSSKDCIAGWLQDTLKVKVKATAGKRQSQ